MGETRQTALVLGAGIMGLAAAWALAGQGYAVTLLDQDPVPNPRGASHDHHRLIRHAYGAEAGYMRMVDHAYAAWDRLWAELGEVLHVETGVLALADAPGGWLAASRAALLAGGHAPETLPGPEVATRFPMLDAAGIADAFHMPEGGVLLADRILASLARLLAARGARFLRGRATAVDPGRAAIRMADGNEHRADLLVVAAGPWAPRLLPALAPRVVPSRQVLVLLQPPPAHRAAWQAAPMLLDLAEDGGFYAVPPVAGTPLKIGDHRFSRRGDAEDDRAATPAEAREILDFARHRIRGLDAYRVVDARACYYDVTIDEHFVLEPLTPRCFVMSGFSGHGFKFAPLLGLALARTAGDAALARALPGWAAGEAPPPAALLHVLERDAA
ncbi:MAG TPA: FAD-dependent oxidoreductase [Roseomonas sp.]|jgi:sarcosine oxidase subunit beta